MSVIAKLRQQLHRFRFADDPEIEASIYPAALHGTDIWNQDFEITSTAHPSNHLLALGW